MLVLAFLAYAQITKEGVTDKQNTQKNISSECVHAGCSGQLCVKSELADQIVTTCEYREEYGCYQKATCTMLETGECGFVQTAELEECLKKAKSPSFIEVQ